MFASAAPDIPVKGLLISRERSADVHTAMGINLFVLSGMLAIGVHQGVTPGFRLTASAHVMGLLAEIGSLLRVFMWTA